MDNKHIKNYDKILFKCSENLIKEDGRMLLEIIQSKSGTVLMELVPYIALYCRSVQEFYRVKVIDKETDDMICDLRNGIKLFSSKFNDNKKNVLNTDETQDKYYKNKLRFSFMKNWNIHDNLGVYFDKGGHVVGNTQSVDFFINISEMKDDEKNQKAFEMGAKLGERVAYIYAQMLGETIAFENPGIVFPHYGYRDFNTNRKNDFFDMKIPKELNLMVLHLVSTIGFIEHVIGFSINKSSLWLVRVEYITAHYVWQSMKKIKQHFDVAAESIEKLDEWDEVLYVGKRLFPSDFRGCMMHYGLFNKKGPSIPIDKFNRDIPFYGLVESCYSGKSYNEFIEELRNYILKLENLLLQWFHLNKNKIKWDLG